MSDDPLDRFIALYQRLDKHSLGDLGEVYDEHAVFEDPAHKIVGLPALTHYFEHLYDAIGECRFDIADRDRCGDRAWLRWQMQLSHPRLAGGQLFNVDGASFLRLTDRVVYHRDYLDLGQMIYERLPVLGAVVRAVRQRVAGA